MRYSVKCQFLDVQIVETWPRNPLICNCNGRWFYKSLTLQENHSREIDTGSVISDKWFQLRFYLRGDFFAHLGVTVGCQRLAFVEVPVRDVQGGERCQGGGSVAQKTLQLTPSQLHNYLTDHIHRSNSVYIQLHCYISSLNSDVFSQESTTLLHHK